jgi:uncharacterized protein (TIGR02757 family)
LNPEKLARFRAGLEALRLRYDARYLSPDPLEFPRRFKRPDDREVVGLIASSFAYGNVATIRASVGKVLAFLGPEPAAFVRSFEPAPGRALFRDFRHRFNSGRDLACLLFFTRQMLDGCGSIGDFFRRGYDETEPHLAGSLTRFTERALGLDPGGLYGRGGLPASAGVRFFFPSPRDGGACKRLNMYLRWMVRPDDGLDFGLWRFVSPAQLVMPLDTHVARIGRHLGWTRRKTADWKMALEVTRSLARADPRDPTKYDFALSRMGILERCPRHRRRVDCDLCNLRQALRSR